MKKNENFSGLMAKLIPLPQEMAERCFSFFKDITPAKRRSVVKIKGENKKGIIVADFSDGDTLEMMTIDGESFVIDSLKEPKKIPYTKTQPDKLPNNEYVYFVPSDVSEGLFGSYLDDKGNELSCIDNTNLILLSREGFNVYASKWGLIIAYNQDEISDSEASKRINKLEKDFMRKRTYRE